ncbi:MAG: hexapeptide transferase [Bacteroidaceae bacterium]|nr:hexapeptide transferase [Bacteroidaceae bacterium]
MNIIDKIVIRYTNFLVKKYRYKLYKEFSLKFKNLIALHHFENKKEEGEDEYIHKWSVLSRRMEPYSYRFFCHYCGHTPNIIPEDIGRTIVEEILNPKKFRDTYSDKNLFPCIIGEDYVPRTIICRINGRMLLDGKFNVADKELETYIGDATSLILKPTVGTHSGQGIIKFDKKGNTFVSPDQKDILSKEFLMRYGRDFCLQEVVKQHQFMDTLCPTSVNTIRLCLYRSVIDNEPIVTASLIRIGKNGSFVDNALSGGVLIGVDLATGELGKFVVDQYGNKQNTWNDVDFSKNTFVVPNWDKVIDFAKYIGGRILHHRLIGLDIALKEDGNPIMIEYNINAFGYWAFMLVNQEVLGPYTDEVVEYCKIMK